MLRRVEQIAHPDRKKEDKVRPYGLFPSKFYNFFEKYEISH